MIDNIFDEVGLAKNVIKNGFSGNRINKREMILVAKHLMWEDGCKAGKTKTELIKFCEENNKSFNIITNSNLINDVVRIAEKYKFKGVDSVQITINEINRIKSIKNFDYQKILFVMLVFAKALKFTFTRAKSKFSDREPIGYYVSNSLLSKIKKLSGYRSSRKNFLYIFNYFYDEGILEPTYYNSIRILFVDEKGKPAIVIDNFDNIIDYYIRYCGGELFYCSNCGSEEKKKGNKKDLCNDCRTNKRREQTRSRVNKHREKHDM